MSEQSRTAGGGSTPGGGPGAGRHPEASAAGGAAAGPQKDSADAGTAPAAAPGQDATPGRTPDPQDAADGPLPASEWEPAPGSGAPQPGWYADPAPAAGATPEPERKPDAAGPVRWKRWLLAGIPAVLILAAIAGIVFSLRGGTSSAQTTDSSPVSSSPGPDGVIAEDVSPFDFKAGDCFVDFEAVTRNATVVSCSTPHAAQIIGTFSYQPSDTFPGKDALNVKAEEVCSAVKLNQDAQKHKALRTTYGMPSEGTWQEGDRRIDCFVIADGGNKLTGSLIGK
ncbi:septum formation family protein [Arthrobacter mobilis]|uniref:Septum formation-related domain-containing protein n=1 Tax=Arthrobacter mobilis TaxID=2724944 RepID=A0A7X6HGJ6_9MICC|nr:septum formation family protein [Arthrobacter mobilis]NKX55262.1 hypothetical protein [Arthrobacter mobilis]